MSVGHCIHTPEGEFVSRKDGCIEDTDSKIVYETVQKEEVVQFLYADYRIAAYVFLTSLNYSISTVSLID